MKTASIIVLLVAFCALLQSAAAGDCECEGEMCSCCEHMKIKHYFDDEICANVSYNAKDLSVQADIIIGGKVVYVYNASVSNPPPVCFGYDGIDICLEFSDLSYSSHELSGCLAASGKIFHKTVAKISIGCFDIHIPTFDEERRHSVAPVKRL